MDNADKCRCHNILDMCNMLVCVSHCDPDWVAELRSALGGKVQVEDYDEEGKMRRKAFSFKAQFGARQTPFAVLYDDKKPIKAFYSEVKECTIEKILEYIKSHGKHSKKDHKRSSGILPQGRRSGGPKS